MTMRTPTHGRSRGQKRWWSLRSDGVLEFLAEDVLWYTVNAASHDGRTLSVDPDGGPYVMVGQAVTLLDGSTFRILAITSVRKVNVRSNAHYDEDDYDLEVLCDVEAVDAAPTGDAHATP